MVDKPTHADRGRSESWCRERQTRRIQDNPFLGYTGQAVRYAAWDWVVKVCVIAGSTDSESNWFDMKSSNTHFFALNYLAAEIIAIQKVPLHVNIIYGWIFNIYL